MFDQIELNNKLEVSTMDSSELKLWPLLMYFVPIYICTRICMDSYNIHWNLSQKMYTVLYFILEVFGWITLNKRNQAGYNITLVAVDCHQENKKGECYPTLANFTWENVNSKWGRHSKIQAFQVDLPWTRCGQIMLHFLTWVNSIWTIYLHILIYIYFLQIWECVTGQCLDQGQIIGRAELLSPVVMPVQTCVSDWDNI